MQAIYMVVPRSFEQDRKGQELPRTFLAHHELESVIAMIVATVVSDTTLGVMTHF